MERLMESVFRNSGKRAIAIMLSLLIVVSMLPVMWNDVEAADNTCGIDEHTHIDECYELICSATDQHTYDNGCYALVCGKEEHIHSEKCYPSKEAVSVSDVKTSVSASDDISSQISESDQPVLLDASELTVGGVWDVGGENIALGSDAVATIEHGDDYQSEEVTVRITATYPTNATNRKLKIELAEGLEWASNGENTILSSALASISKQEGMSTVYKCKLNNGYYTYSFNEGVASVSVTIRVKKPVATNFASVEDAIKVTATCTENGNSLSTATSLKNLQCEQFSHIGYINTRLEKTVKAEEIAFSYGFVLNSYDSTHLISHNRLYDYAEVTVTAPKGVTLLSTNVSHSGSGGISDIVSPGWYVVSTDDSADDVTKYTVRTDGIYSVVIGSTFEWIFPESFAGQTALIKYSDITWKLYGDDTVYSLPSNIARETYYNVVPSNTVNEIVEGDNIVAQFSEDTCSPDAVYKMGGFVLRNKGSDDSVPKVVEYNFDDSIGITNVTLAVPMKGTPSVKVWYKVQGDDTWHEKTVTKKLAKDMTETLLGRMDVTNLDLGLSADTYISALKYEFDSLVDDNGTPDDTSDDIRIGIPAGKSATGFSNSSVNTGAHNPFAGVNLKLSASNPTAISTVTIRDKYDNGVNEPLTYTVTTKYNAKPENYMYVVGNTVLEKHAGESFTVSAQITVNWAAQSSQPYSVGFNQYPIIYIRDETGVGISGIKLTNNNGVDILTKYPDNISVTLDHTETVDHNGDGKYAKVYKIDTTGLSTLPSKADRYAAAVGYWDSTATKYKLNLSYTVYTPGTYDDGGIVHKLSEAIFLSDPLMYNRSNKSNGSRLDPYDVDNDGITTGDKDIFQSANQSSVLTAEYTIAPSADISVASAVKKASDANAPYTSWDGSDSYLQIQSGETYNVRNSVYNGSGVTTSTEDGKRTVIYIPIPKKGDQWDQANSGVDKDGKAISTFAYDMTLSAPIKNPDTNVFTISYGTVNTSIFNSGDSQQVLGTTLSSAPISWSSSYSASTNCVRIIVNAMAPSEAVSDARNFILPLVADEDAVNREVNIFSGFYYEDITNISGDTFKLWKFSDKLALQIAEGEISGRLWIDQNGNGLQDANEVGLANTTVTLAGGESRTATTNANGEYSFTKLPLGEYSVSFTPDTDAYSLSEKDAGNDNLDSDAVLSGTKAQITGIVIPSTDNLGKQTFVLENLDAGLVPYVDIIYNFYAESEDDIPDGVYPPSGSTVSAGTEYTADVVDEVTGYTFDGWYSDGGLTEKFADGTAVTEDIVLYGIWTINKYTVTYEFVGDAPAGTQAPESDTVPYGSAYSAKAADEVDNYLFDGWYTNESCTAKFADDTTVTDNIQLYGKWIYNRITVGGDVKWADVPDGLSIPTVTIDLLSGGKVIDSVELQPDETEYSFDNVAKYADADSTIEYTVQVRPVANYEATYSTPATDANGNITIDITNTGKFIYSNLEITNNVTGNAADTTLKFPFMVEFGSSGSYEYEIVNTDSASTLSARAGKGTIRNGDTIELSHGETAIIYGLPAGVTYKVTELDTKGYKMTSVDAEGTVAEDGSNAIFFNEKKTAVKGASDTPETGDDNGIVIAVYVMQIALLSMLLCVFFAKKRRRENEEKQF